MKTTIEGGGRYVFGWFHVGTVVGQVYRPGQQFPQLRVLGRQLLGG